MKFLSLPLVSWITGTVMIGVFVLVVIGLIATIFLLMKSDKKAK